MEEVCPKCGYCKHCGRSNETQKTNETPVGPSAPWKFNHGPATTITSPKIDYQVYQTNTGVAPATLAAIDNTVTSCNPTATATYIPISTTWTMNPK
jgi:hypothetical protein